MPGKPTAARGKTTRKGKIKKILKQKMSDVMRRQSKTKSPSAMSGPATAGLTAAAARLAKRLKPSGRLNADDIKRIKQMMSKRKGK